MVRLLFTVLGILTAAFALTSEYCGGILRDIIDWLY